MKANPENLSARYLAVLRTHLKQAPNANLESAGVMGRRAARIGLQTADVARIHGRALTELWSPPGSFMNGDGLMRRAEAFFIEAIKPIEQNHRAALEASIELLEESQRQQEQLRQLARRFISALEQERSEISRELHNEIAQTLTGINVHLCSLSKQAAVNARGLSQTISHTQRLVEKSVNIVHRFARDLRPTLLDDLGLVPAMHSFMKDFTKRTGIHIHFTASAGLAQLGTARRTVLYRVAQSALINVAQHAQASRVDVSILKLRDTIRMEIHDDGKSFDVERVLFAKRRKPLGLLGMRERVEMVGGSFRVESAAGEGTTIHVQIPLRKGAKEKLAK